MVQIIVCVILSVYIIYLIELPVQKRNVFYKVTRLSEKKRENLGVKNLKKEKNLMFIRWTYEWQEKEISVTKEGLLSLIKQFYVTRRQRWRCI